MADNNVSESNGKKNKIIWIVLAAVFVAVFAIGLTLFFVLRNDATIKLSGKGTAEDPFVISSKADLDEFATVMKKNSRGYGGKYFRLDADIDLQSGKWTPVPFCGKFDGNGKTISNLEILGDMEYVGFFSTVTAGDNAGVYDLTLTGVKIKSHSDVRALGGIVGMTDADITGCTVNAEFELTGSPAYVGGIAGSVTGDVENCKTTGGKISATVSERIKGDNSTYAWPAYGGIVGHLTGSAENCENNMTFDLRRIAPDGNTDKHLLTGGVIGSAHGRGSDNEFEHTEYKRLVNNADIKGVGAVGGVVASLDTNNAVISDCMNYGDLYTESDTDVCDVGGILGRTYTHANGIPEIKNCGNEGDIAALSIARTGANGEAKINQCWIGGILGAGNVDVTACYAKSNITVNGVHTHYVGGLCGGITGCLKDSYHIGDVTVPTAGSVMAGGLIGVLQSYDYYFGDPDKLTISAYRNYNVGGVAVKVNSDTVVGNANHLAGGVIGYNMQEQTPILNNYFDSTVRGNYTVPEGFSSYEFWYGEETEADNITETSRANNGGLTTAQLTAELPAGFVPYGGDGENAVWVLVQGEYPMLYWQQDAQA